MQKGNFIQRALQFAESKGFYMILGLCVVAIGVSTYVLFFTAPQEKPVEGELINQSATEPKVSAVNPVPDVKVPQEQPTQPAAPEKPTEPEHSVSDVPPAQTPVTEPKPVVRTDPPSNAVQVSGNTKVKTPVFTYPVKESQVQREYSGEALVFDPTMGDWRTHGGTDFACDEGDEVLAVLDGVVAEIYEDAMMGQCLRIDHGAQLESLYCGVLPQDGIKVGTKVATGQTIGRVGDDVLAESAQECHLHLEMTEEGVAVDPLSILK
ncbi:MAG: peptidoglycan DD-metalloendopeptidase family protein [Clostridia bacterium]|nr:peptidoglycan DD-metalloendopeptidase family protein [Clostridia bacterium]